MRQFSSQFDIFPVDVAFNWTVCDRLTEWLAEQMLFAMFCLSSFFVFFEALIIFIFVFYLFLVCNQMKKFIEFTLKM